MATVTKRDLVAEVSRLSGLSHQEASISLDAILSVITAKLSEGDRVILRNFGVFSVDVSRAKKGRNPMKPEVEITIPERCKIRFRPGVELRDAVQDIAPSKIKLQPPEEDEAE